MVARHDIRFVCVLTCALLPACASGAAAEGEHTPAVLEGTLLSTIRGGGQWRLYFNAAQAAVCAADRDALWFGKGPNVWRYNVARRAIDAQASLLTHPSCDTDYGVALAEDGRLAMSGRAAGYLWSPKNGWSRLPQPAGESSSYDPVFDSTGTLWAVGFVQAFEWVDGTWAESRKLPAQSGVYPVGDGWLMWNKTGGSVGESRAPYAWFPRTFGDHPDYAYANEVGKYLFGRFFGIGKDTYGVFWYTPPGEKWDDSIYAVCRITKDGFQERIQGLSIGLDLASGDVFACVPNAEGTRLTVQSPDGNPLGEMPAPPPQIERRSFFLRDANGHYWRGHWRFDGNSWTPVMPANAFDFGDSPDHLYAGDFREAIASGRLRFDEQKQTWIDAWPEIPVAVQGYDPKTRTGWLERQRPDDNPEYPWDQFAFADDGSKRLLRSADIKRRQFSFPVPNFQDPAGNWWFGTRWRWDGKEAHEVDDGWEGRGSDKEGKPEIFSSPKGSVWMYHTSRVWKRFNPQSDRFEEAAPYDDFAFDFCGRTFAVVGRPRDSAWDWNSHLGRLYEKRSGVWDEASDPFAESQVIPRSITWTQARLYGYAGSLVRQDRMLLSCNLGVFEWDAKSGRWAFLLPYENYWAFFDQRGRRVFVSNNRPAQILVYEGDPVDNQIVRGADDPAAKLWPLPPDSAASAGDVLAATLKRLLVEMDDDAWNKREAAMQEMIGLPLANPDDIAAFLAGLDRAKLSAEVSFRIKIVLKKREAAQALAPKPKPKQRSYDEPRFLWRRKVGNSLFDRMNPSLVAAFPGGYVIRPGMRYALAKSIFQAAGARYATDVHNQQYPDLTYQGYLLHDYTMVYLRVENKDATGKIISIGLGRRGEGYDRDWPWDDATKNSLPSLELTPLTTMIPE